MEFRISGEKIHIDVKAVPGASKTEFAGIENERIRVRIAAAPEDGKANEELCRFLAKIVGCAKRDVVLVKGEKSRLKTLAFPLAYKIKFDNIINEVQQK
jgi:uncharacterized protein (TIGR00251 family)